MSAHDKLKAHGITPTRDAERAYRLGLADATCHCKDQLARINAKQAANTDLRKTAAGN